MKWRDATGVEHKKVLGRVWSASGRPPECYLTKQQTQRALDESLAKARSVGPGARRRIGSQPTFADAAQEWLSTEEVHSLATVTALGRHRATPLKTRDDRLGRAAHPWSLR